MIIVDTGFLSSLLKINKLKLILDALNAENIVIPSTVYEELRKTKSFSDLLSMLAFSENDLSKERFILVKHVDLERISQFFKPEKISGLGKGEISCMLLAKKFGGKVLMDDRCAVKTAKEEGINVVSLPTFIVYCKNEGVLSKREVQQIINDLKKKDFYEFPREVKRILDDC